MIKVGRRRKGSRRKRGGERGDKTIRQGTTAKKKEEMSVEKEE